MLISEMTRARQLFKARLVVTNIAKFSTTNRVHHQDDQLKVFKDNASKWWTGKEFSILRSMNEIRVPFIVEGIGKPIDESKIMDVGCGGGILSESLARLGANVMGIDPVFESINQAQIHASLDPDLGERLKYRSCNVEDLSALPEHKEAYDALVASEVLEHIEDVEGFLVNCSKLIKPNGSLFITTINQTPLSWLGVIFFGEYVLQQLPKGTHTYDMFVSVKGLRVMLERLGFHIKLVNGFMYEPISGKFYWTPSTLTHYAIQAVKTVPMTKGLNYEQRRYMAKSSTKKTKANRPKVPLDDDDMRPVIHIEMYRNKTAELIAEFKEHLDKNLAIRASTATFDTLKIEMEGLNEPLELRDVAQVSMKGSNLIVINLSTMPEAIKPTLKALEDLGNLNPQVEVNNIYLPIPRISREHREKLASLAKQAATNTKDKLRALFSDFSGRAKRMDGSGGISSDLIYNTVENIQFDLNKNLSEIDNLLQTKIDRLLNQKS